MTSSKNGLTQAVDDEESIRSCFAKSINDVAADRLEIAKVSLQDLSNSIIGDDICDRNPVSAYLLWICLDALLGLSLRVPEHVFDDQPLQNANDSANDPGSRKIARSANELSKGLGPRLARLLYKEDTALRKASVVQRRFVENLNDRPMSSDSSVKLSRDGFAKFLTTNQGACLGLLCCIAHSELEQFLEQDSFKDNRLELGRLLATVQTILQVLDHDRVSETLERALKNSDWPKHHNVFGTTIPAARQLSSRYEAALRRASERAPDVSVNDWRRLAIDSHLRGKPTDGSVTTPPNNGSSHLIGPTEEGDEQRPSPWPLRDTFLELLERLIGERKCAFIPITETHLIYADVNSGRILGPMGEGTSAIVLFARRRSGIANSPNQIGFAVRVPKLSTGNMIQNFENAETCYLEHTQAHSVPAHGSLGVPIDSGCLHRLLNVDSVSSLNLDQSYSPGSSSGAEMLVALNMSPGLAPRVGIVTRSFIWPKSLSAVLTKSGGAASEIFDQLNDAMQRSREAHAKTSSSADAEMPPIVLVREPGGLTPELDDQAFSYIDRTRVENLYSKEKMSGWAFGVPFMVCDWLTTDLHRLMSGLVGTHGKPEDAEPMIKNVRAQPLSSWFSLCASLSEGLNSIHSLMPGGDPMCVHGDVRPANVMFLRGANFLQCRWIDIGSGSLTARERRLSQARRSSVFYAWERIEHVSEEHDQVEFFIDDSGAQRKYHIRFLFRDDNLKTPSPVTLRGADSARGKLSLLLPGDRLVIGDEFIFRVKQLHEDYLEVDEGWEIISGRIPVKTKLHELFEQRGHKSISEFKILWQWGVPSDVYGMGMIILYVFYMRGLYGVTKFGDRSSTQDITSQPIDLDDGFENLLSAIRTPGFLGAFLRSLDVSPETKSARTGLKVEVQFCKKADLFELRPEVVQYVRTQRNDGVQTNRDDLLGDDPKVRKLIDIVEELRVFAPELENVFFGVNSNPAVFTMLMYIVLGCLWREDEIGRLSKSVVEGVEDVEFQPYCSSRVSDGVDDLGAPSHLLWQDLQRIANHLAAPSVSLNLYNSARPIVEAGGSNKQVTGNLFNVVRAQRGELERLRSGATQALDGLESLGKSQGSNVRLAAVKLVGGKALRAKLDAIQLILKEMQQLAGGDTSLRGDS